MNASIFCFLIKIRAFLWYKNKKCFIIGFKMKISDTISKAIKEGKWLNVSYVNQNNEKLFIG